MDIATNTVEYTTQKEFIAVISLKPCGCIEETAENIATIQTCCPDVYSCYFAPCCQTNSDATYRVFEETGLIQLKNYHSDKLYMEYRGFMGKKNGVYQVPSICKETLVEYTKYKSIRNKRGVSNIDKQNALDDYRRERGNMNKVLFTTSLADIIRSSLTVPKFDWYVKVEEYCSSPTTVATPATSTACAAETSVACAPTSNKSQLLFSYAGIVGIGNAPVDSATSYQNDKFKNALNIEHIIIDNTIYSLNKDEFTLNTTDGIIALTNGNSFFTGSSLIVPTFSKLI